MPDDAAPAGQRRAAAAAADGRSRAAAQVADSNAVAVPAPVDCSTAAWDCSRVVLAPMPEPEQEHIVAVAEAAADIHRVRNHSD